MWIHRPPVTFTHSLLFVMCNNGDSSISFQTPPPVATCWDSPTAVLAASWSWLPMCTVGTWLAWVPHTWPCQETVAYHLLARTVHSGPVAGGHSSGYRGRGPCWRSQTPGGEGGKARSIFTLCGMHHKLPVTASCEQLIVQKQFAVPASPCMFHVKVVLIWLLCAGYAHTRLHVSTPSFKSVLCPWWRSFPLYHDAVSECLRSVERLMIAWLQWLHTTVWFLAANSKDCKITLASCDHAMLTNQINKAWPGPRYLWMA